MLPLFEYQYLEEERIRINNAFQAFFNEMKYMEDEEGNVRLYSKKRGNKKDGELFTVFRDLARGIRLDKKSEAAVRQSISNISSLEQNIKDHFLNFFDIWSSKKRAPWGKNQLVQKLL